MLVAEELDVSPGVKTLEELTGIIKNAKALGKKIVHCHGVFDLLHVGHIRHLEKAKQFGDLLVVTLTPDQYVNKGPHRPAFTEILRADAINALQFVDYVAINKWPIAVNAIKLLAPDYYVKGSDYQNVLADKTQGIVLEKKAVESAGGSLVFTDEVMFSSSSLINKYFSPFRSDMGVFLKEFSQQYSYEEIERYIESLQTLKVLVVGESIVDDYHYCRTMGKSGKDPILAVCFERSETFAGGVLAVANHVAAFTDNVDVLTFLGEKSSYKEFVESKLDKKIKRRFITVKTEAPIVKRRFVESYPFQKLFEVYLMDNTENCEDNSKLLDEDLQAILSGYDVVIVTDYGHGMFYDNVIKTLCSQAKFLAVNTQINAGNQAFNTISKYPRADFISISENEIRVDARSKKKSLEEIILSLSKKLKVPNVLVTRGEKGLLSYSEEEGFCAVPGFSGKTVDRVGAGDSVLAVTAMCVKKKMPLQVVGLLGDAVGFQTTQKVGNKTAANRLDLLRFLEHSLK